MGWITDNLDKLEHMDIAIIGQQGWVYVQGYSSWLTDQIHQTFQFLNFR